ncbi:McrB family protein [Paraclostridium sordellii]|uniref:McrB family protein n=1 Tax=Paraclostridium sordellii TaxID=1505 RepID=UPI0005E81277|nr:AAA family ATPase [Paeniclostridium sordellii]CEQ27362.1 ATPase [[Clostridium] sordellii] [Paeniclostridium sordellii]
MAMNKSESLYFDRVTRTNKLQTLNAFANAVYHLKDSKLIKEKLGEYLDIFRDPPRGKETGAGSYTEKAYDSIYTPALEFGVLEITTPEYKLSNLAERMVEGEVSQKYFFTTVMMNLNQVINGKVVNPLYETLVLMKSKGIIELSKEDITQVTVLNLPTEERNNRNMYFELLSDTYFFEKINSSKLKFVSNYGDLDKIISACNITLYNIEESKVEEAYCGVGKQTNYTQFITKENEYLKNITKNINLYSNKSEYISEKNSTNDYIVNYKGFNKIICGAPGTGKSNYIQKNYYAKSPSTSKRITFHPEYTYNDFIGYIKPKVDEENNLKYEFSPGPFTEIVCESLLNKNTVYNLIIDEINRANAAAVFGDLFQLLDRDSNTFNSEYSVHNRDMHEYIKDKFEKEGKQPILNDGEVYIPNNLNIIATMNTADQNVFIMDTAFKRRWEFEYMDIDFRGCDFRNVKISKLDIEWEKFARTINKFMMSIDCSDLMIPEDKQVGPFFIKKSELYDSKKFAYKVLMYLWDDVFKMERERVFNSNLRTFSQVVNKFDSDSAITVFNEDIKKILKDDEYIKEHILSDDYALEQENETPEDGDVYEEI